MALMALVFAMAGQHAWQETRDPAFSGDFLEIPMHNATSCMLFGAAQSGDWDYATDVGDACFELTNDLEIKTSLFVRLDTPNLTINASPGSPYDGTLDAGGAASTGNVFFADYQDRGLKIMLSTFWGQWLLFNEGADRNSTSYTKPTPSGLGIPVVISDTSTSGNFLWFEHDGSDSRIHATGTIKIDSPVALIQSGADGNEPITVIEVSPDVGARSIILIGMHGDYEIQLGNRGVSGLGTPNTDAEVTIVLQSAAFGGLSMFDLVGQQEVPAGGVYLSTDYSTVTFFYSYSLDTWIYSGGSNN